jgi:hypothetical protein
MDAWLNGVLPLLYLLLGYALGVRRNGNGHKPGHPSQHGTEWPDEPWTGEEERKP